MDSKLLKFIVKLSIISVLVWIVGEIIIVAVMRLGGVVSLIWSIIMLAVIITLSMTRSFKNDDDQNDRNW